MKNSAQQNMKAGDVSLGLTHHFIGAFGRAGGTPEMLQQAADNRSLMRQLVELFHPAVSTAEGNMLQIDRSTPFNHAAFLGNGWSIVEQDERSLALPEIDLNKISFETTLRPGEVSIKGEEKLRRLKEAGHIRLDAQVLQTLWENQHLIPESWKEKTGGNTTYIFFDGTILQRPDGDRYVLYLYWYDGEWHWHCRWLGSDWFAMNPSACLAS